MSLNFCKYRSELLSPSSFQVNFEGEKKFRTFTWSALRCRYLHHRLHWTLPSAVVLFCDGRKRKTYPPNSAVARRLTAVATQNCVCSQITPPYLWLLIRSGVCHVTLSYYAGERRNFTCTQFRRVLQLCALWLFLKDFTPWCLTSDSLILDVRKTKKALPKRHLWEGSRITYRIMWANLNPGETMNEINAGISFKVSLITNQSIITKSCIKYFYSCKHRFCRCRSSGL